MSTEYGFKQLIYDHGGVDFSLTNYEPIERWGEISFSPDLLVSIQATNFQFSQQLSTTSTSDLCSLTNSNLFQHSPPPDWLSGTTWKIALNNLRLIIQP